MLNAKLPRISIVTPNYNYGRFIGAAMESVLSQNYGYRGTIIGAKYLSSNWIIFARPWNGACVPLQLRRIMA